MLLALVAACHVAAALGSDAALMPMGAGQASAYTPECENNRVVPQFFLLGHQKAGTTTLAHLLFDLGARSAGDTLPGGNSGCFAKEIHYMDWTCTKGGGNDLAGEYCKSGMFQRWGVGADHLKHHKKPVPTQYMQCSQWQRECGSGRGSGGGAPWDMTPDNAAIPGLATALHARLQSHGAWKFNFIILIREGLARMSSAYYMAVDDGHEAEVDHQKSFSAYADMVVKQFPDYWAAKKYFWKGLSSQADLVNGEYNCYGRSLYSLNLNEWISTWGQQVAIVPMRYLESPATILQFISDLGGNSVPSGLDLNKKPTSPADNNVRKHAPPEKDLSRDVLKNLQEHFDADLHELVTVIKKHGARVAGTDKLFASTSNPANTTAPISSISDGALYDHLKKNM